ncbi:MAG: hypothetical protein ACPLYF_02715, partial [Fervidobacterium sp.]
MSSEKPHENIRMQVVNEVIKIVKEILERKAQLRDENIYSAALRRLLERSDSLPLIAKQEVRAGEERRWVDIVFSGEIVFEIKGEESEFDEAYEKYKKIYLPSLPNAKYFIITNWDKWRVYRVERKDGVVELLNERRAGIEEARNILNEILSEMKQFKILPTPENVEKLFSIEKEELLKKLREAFEGVKEKQNVMPLFNAYSKIIRMLYGKEATEEFIEDLFVRHTLM